MSESAKALHEPWPGLARQREAVSFGMWVFLTTEVLFFSGLFLGYAVYRHLHPHAFTIAARETNVIYGTVNTAILLTSSLTMALAAEACERGLRRMAIWCLAATGTLGAAFLVVKGFEYAEDLSRGLFPGPHFPLQPAATQLFWTFYWLMTGVHAVHLTVGIGAVAIVAALLWRGRLSTKATTFEALALYWHLIDLIWIFLLPLLYLVGRS